MGRLTFYVSRDYFDKPAFPEGTTNIENDPFLKFLFTRRAGMNRHGKTEDYTVPLQSGGTRKSVLVAPRTMRGATHHLALCAIFG